MQASSPGPSSDPDTGARLTEVEIKLAFTEDLVEALNHTVYQQQLAIVQLQQELRAIRLQVANQPGGPAATLRDEIPPHY